MIRVDEAHDHYLDVLDLITGKSLPPLCVPNSFADSFSISADGRTLLAGCRDGDAFVWNLTNGHLIRRLGAQRDLTTQTTRPTYAGMVNPVPTDVALSSYGHFALTSANGESPRLWDLTNGAQLPFLSMGDKVLIRSVVFSRDGTLAAVTGPGFTRIWSLLTHRDLPSFNDDELGTIAAFTPDGHQIAIGGADGKIRLWDVVSGKLLRIYTGHSGWVEFLNFNAAGTRLLSGSDDGTANFWDFASCRNCYPDALGYGQQVETIIADWRSALKNRCRPLTYFYCPFFLKGPS